MKELKAPPRDNLIRAVRPGLELRAGEGDDAMPTLVGHFAVFNQWTEIDSFWEGTFMEQLAPGAFAKTFKENRSSIKITLNHGMDVLGDQILAMPKVLREDDEGAYYEAPLFKGIPELVMEGLRHDAYGASFRFNVMKEQFEESPKPSKSNPTGMPERTILEAKVMEFGPVTFPAYEGASAGIRSLTEAYISRRLGIDPDRLHEFLLQQRSPTAGAGATHSEPDPALPSSEPIPLTPKKEAAPVVPVQPRFKSREEYLEWISRN